MQTQARLCRHGAQLVGSAARDRAEDPHPQPDDHQTSNTSFQLSKTNLFRHNCKLGREVRQKSDWQALGRANGRSGRGRAALVYAASRRLLARPEAASAVARTDTARRPAYSNAADALSMTSTASLQHTSQNRLPISAVGASLREMRRAMRHGSQVSLGPPSRVMSVARLGGSLWLR